MSDLSYEPVEHNHALFLQKALKRKTFKQSYTALEGEYLLLREMLAARLNAGLSQAEVAERMGTTTSVVSRLESAAKHTPSLATLQKYAQAVGCQLEIKLVPKQV